MADCTLPQNWNIPGCDPNLPVMDTPATTPAAGGGSNAYASIPRPAAPGVVPVAASGGFPWWLLAVGVGAYVVSRPGKTGLHGTDAEDTGTDAPVELNGPRRRKPRPAPQPQPAPRPAPKPRTHGQHRATLVIS